MRLYPLKIIVLIPLCLTFFLSACYKPPYNNFEPAPAHVIDESNGYYKPMHFFTSKKKLLLRKLNEGDIQYVEYGDTRTLIIPTDRYFEFESPRFNELCYKTFNTIFLFLRLYRCSEIHIAGFTDDVGSKHHHDKLTQARAETMLTYLWANGFKSAQLSAEGYGHHYPIANNKLVHGAAQNRRLEIQWFQRPNCKKSAPQSVMTK